MAKKTAEEKKKSSMSAMPKSRKVNAQHPVVPLYFILFYCVLLQSNLHIKNRDIRKIRNFFAAYQFILAFLS